MYRFTQFFKCSLLNRYANAFVNLKFQVQNLTKPPRTSCYPLPLQKLHRGQNVLYLGGSFPGLIKFKSVSGSLWEKIYFPLCNLSLTGWVWPVSQCSITTIKWSDELHSLVSPGLTFTAKSRHDASYQTTPIPSVFHR